MTDLFLNMNHINDIASFTAACSINKFKIHRLQQEKAVLKEMADKFYPCNKCANSRENGLPNGGTCGCDFCDKTSTLENYWREKLNTNGSNS